VLQADAEGWGTAAYCRRALRLGHEAAQRGDRSYELLAWALANSCPWRYEYDEDGADLPKIPPLAVPHGTRVVVAKAFQGIMQLKAVSLPASLTRIESDALESCDRPQQERPAGAIGGVLRWQRDGP
jgi:hypothetical protein